jgi:hypothetical protein
MHHEADRIAKLRQRLPLDGRPLPGWRLVDRVEQISTPETTEYQRRLRERREAW